MISLSEVTVKGEFVRKTCFYGTFISVICVIQRDRWEGGIRATRAFYVNFLQMETLRSKQSKVKTTEGCPGLSQLSKDDSIGLTLSSLR
jgi:hypothetical protein